MNADIIMHSKLAGTLTHTLQKQTHKPDLTLLEGESTQTMFERGAFLTTEDGGMSVLAGATMGEAQASRLLPWLALSAAGLLPAGTLLAACLHPACSRRAACLQQRAWRLHCRCVAAATLKPQNTTTHTHTYAHPYRRRRHQDQLVRVAAYPRPRPC